jgi:Icc-related predicted phosphoesterase
MRRSVNRIVATAEPRGNLETVAHLVKQADEMSADAVVVLGNLAPRGTARAYNQLFKSLSQMQVPTFYLPGPEDAPIAEYMREAAVMETVYPYLHGVHGTFALAHGHVVFTGVGGSISDDQQAARDEHDRLCYPGWEVEYRLKFLNELKDYQKVFLFSTLPEHKGFHEPGSAVLAEMIKSYKPRLVLVAGAEPKREQLGTSLVVVPGSLIEGKMSFIDLREHTVETRLMRI